MSTVEEIKTAIGRLSLEERAEITAELCGWTDDDWDRQMKSDAAAGKFSKLNREADAVHRAGQTLPPALGVGSYNRQSQRSHKGVSEPRSRPRQQVRHVAGTADAQSLGNPVARHRGFAPEFVCKGGLVRMALRVTIQVRFRPSHFF